MAMRLLVARKARIGAEFGFADLLGQLPEGPVIADADEDIGGPRREDRIRHKIGMLLPVSCGGLPCMK